MNKDVLLKKQLKNIINNFVKEKELYVNSDEYEREAFLKDGKSINIDLVDLVCSLYSRDF